MILAKFVKQPAEVLDYDIDFSEFLTEGDTIASTGDPPTPIGGSVVCSPAGLIIGSTFVIQGTTIKQWLSGGVDGQKYKVTITMTSNAGRVKQVEFVVRVKDE